VPGVPFSDFSWVHFYDLPLSGDAIKRTSEDPHNSKMRSNLLSTVFFKKSPYPFHPKKCGLDSLNQSPEHIGNDLCTNHKMQRRLGIRADLRWSSTTSGNLTPLFPYDGCEAEETYGSAWHGVSYQDDKSPFSPSKTTLTGDFFILESSS